MVRSDDGAFPSNTVFEDFEAGVLFYAGAGVQLACIRL